MPFVVKKSGNYIIENHFKTKCYYIVYTNKCLIIEVNQKKKLFVFSKFDRLENC